MLTRDTPTTNGHLCSDTPWQYHRPVAQIRSTAVGYEPVLACVTYCVLHVSSQERTRMYCDYHVHLDKLFNVFTLQCVPT